MSSALLIPKRPPLRDPRYLDLVREMPCVLTGATPCDPAHIRWGLGGGASLKPGDDRVLPLRHDLHQMQHGMSEASFWHEAVAGRILLASPRMATELLMRGLIALARKRYRETVGHAGGSDER